MAITSVYRNRYKADISNVPGTAGGFVLDLPTPGYQSWVSGDNGLAFDLFISEGLNWEIRTGCTYTHSTLTLTRGTLESSSTGAAISFGSSANVEVTLTAARLNAIKALVP